MNETPPQVGIILVNYNGYGDTAECITSLSEIDYSNYSIYVVDNNSTDGSRDRLKEQFPNVTMIPSETNRGFTGGNNLGIKKALSHNVDYVLLLNNDTVVQNDFLTQLVETAESNNQAGIIGGEIRNYDNPNFVWYSGGDFQKLTGLVSPNKEPHSDIEKATFVTGCLMLVDSDVIEDIGMLRDEYFMYFEDVEYGYRYLQSGGEILVDPDAKIHHKEGSSTDEDDVASPLRAYYDTRNRLLFSLNELSFPYNITSTLILVITRVWLIFYWWYRSSFLAAKACFLGLIDGIRGKTGKHPQYP